MTYDIVGAASIRPYVQINISSDGRYLSGSLRLPNGKMLQRTINLVPIRNYILNQMKAWHEQQHGSLPPQEVSGFFSSLFDKAKSIAKKVASSSAVKSLYEAAKKYGPDALATLPFGDKAVALAKKIHDRVVEARGGSEEAIAKLRQISEMAKAGLPAAQVSMDMAKSISATLNAKETMDQIAPKATGLLVAAKSGSFEAVDKINSLKDIASSGDPKAQDVMALMSRLNDFLKAKQGGQTVSGWLYNRPYRSPFQSITDKTPGLGMMARSLYRDGMGS